jgi:hypothetical protein
MINKDKYLASSKYIDCKDEAIQLIAKKLSKNAVDQNNVIKNCFEFVRDEIKHSCDHYSKYVTVKASDVLKYHTGFCYAKSHLLAALLRANNIPTALCYQRLKVDESSFCLHGLNAVYIENIGWFRLDARGNNDQVSSSFNIDKEDLAYSVKELGEIDLPELWDKPLEIVVNILENSKTNQEVVDNIPDIEII